MLLPEVSFHRSNPDERVLLSLSWYASVPTAETPLTLSRDSTPQLRGDPSLRTRVWLASRCKTVGPGTAYDERSPPASAQTANDMEFGLRHKQMNGLHFCLLVCDDQRLRTLIADHCPQDMGHFSSRGDSSYTIRLGSTEFAIITPENGLM
jgi:hypothetical protein